MNISFEHWLDTAFVTALTYKEFNTIEHAVELEQYLKKHVPTWDEHVMKANSKHIANYAITLLINQKGKETQESAYDIVQKINTHIKPYNQPVTNYLVNHQMKQNKEKSHIDNNLNTMTQSIEDIHTLSQQDIEQACSNGIFKTYTEATQLDLITTLLTKHKKSFNDNQIGNHLDQVAIGLYQRYRLYQFDKRNQCIQNTHYKDMLPLYGITNKTTNPTKPYAPYNATTIEELFDEMVAHALTKGDIQYHVTLAYVNQLRSQQNMEKTEASHASFMTAYHAQLNETLDHIHEQQSNAYDMNAHVRSFVHALIEPQNIDIENDTVKSYVATAYVIKEPTYHRFSEDIPTINILSAIIEYQQDVYQKRNYRNIHQQPYTQHTLAELNRTWYGQFISELSRRIDEHTCDIQEIIQHITTHTKDTKHLKQLMYDLIDYQWKEEQWHQQNQSDNTYRVHETLYTKAANRPKNPIVNAYMNTQDEQPSSVRSGLYRALLKNKKPLTPYNKEHIQHIIDVISQHNIDYYAYASEIPNTYFDERTASHFMQNATLPHITTLLLHQRFGIQNKSYAEQYEWLIEENKRITTFQIDITPYFSIPYI